VSQQPGLPPHKHRLSLSLSLSLSVALALALALQPGSVALALPLVLQPVSWAQPPVFGILDLEFLRKSGSERMWTGTLAGGRHAPWLAPWPG